MARRQSPSRKPPGPSGGGRGTGEEGGSKKSSTTRPGGGESLASHRKAPPQAKNAKNQKANSSNPQASYLKDLSTFPRRSLAEMRPVSRHRTVGGSAGGAVSATSCDLEARRSARYGRSTGWEKSRSTANVGADYWERKPRHRQPGYAVGAINTHTGLTVDGFEMVFMRIDGDRLDPEDSYSSPWLGDEKGGTPRDVSSDGKSRGPSRQRGRGSLWPRDDRGRKKIVHDHR